MGHLWVLVLVLSCPSQVTMQKQFNLSYPQFLFLSNDNNYVSCFFHEPTVMTERCWVCKYLQEILKCGKEVWDFHLWQSEFMPLCHFWMSSGLFAGTRHWLWLLSAFCSSVCLNLVLPLHIVHSLGSILPPSLALSEYYAIAIFRNMVIMESQSFFPAPDTWSHLLYSELMASAGLKLLVTLCAILLKYGLTIVGVASTTKK